MVNFCPKCGKGIEKDQKFCPDCGQVLTLPSSPQQTPVAPFHYQKNTNKPVAGGILLIIAAVFCLIASVFVIIFKSYSYSYDYSYPYSSYSYFNWWIIIVVIFEIWGFAIGLAGGIFSLKRNHFPIAIIGASFVLVAGCFDFIGTFILGIIILILGILSTIFIALSKNEFRSR